MKCNAALTYWSRKPMWFLELFCDKYRNITNSTKRSVFLPY